MAASLLALLDDIASVLDDVAAMTKVAGRKTAGVLGDDLALNAQQVAGVRPERELPVVWAVARGSLVNKAILVPAALAISAVAPWAVTPLLLAGGLFLCFEGAEKIVHKLLHHRESEQHRAQLSRALAQPAADLLSLEKAKIRGAVRTDFILSAEIIVITLGTVATASLGTRIGVLVSVALLMTAGVYGLVAAIVKLDDAGLALSRLTGPGATTAFARTMGDALLRMAPWLMKLLSVAGTAAMFLVGGGILTHSLPWLHTALTRWMPDDAAVLRTIVSFGVDASVGVAAGLMAVAVISVISRVRRAATGAR
jgi:predicted DNA repair protein MutK